MPHAREPLTREQRVRLARVLAWSRRNGWVHDAYPNTWRSADGETHVRYDTADGALVVSDLKEGQDPLKCRVALIPISSPEVAIDVLIAMRYLPVRLTTRRPLAPGYGLHDDDDEVADDATRFLYRALMPDGVHQYISTHCQHGHHDDCRRTCKWCGAACVCSGCLHTPPFFPLVVEPLPADYAVDPNGFDGPASFIEAGQAFADLCGGSVSAEQAAQILSRLARDGLITRTDGYYEAAAEIPGQTDLMDELAAIIAQDEAQ